MDRRYPISIAGLVGGLMLPNDILDVVTLMAANWSVMQALLPWFGVIMIAGFGAWLVQLLIADVPRLVRRKVKERRDYWSSVIRRVADDLETALQDPTLKGTNRFRGSMRFDMDQLGDKKLFPLLRRPGDQAKKNGGQEDKDLAVVATGLYQLIPIVETFGVRQARRRIRLANRRWRENPDLNEWEL